ncbi:MAG: helix-turn-helix transcriptional regulator [Chloroflexi bacterium]|nr:helix-turn-helix transcriptional regulator [Chloroflexota bacterium]
MSHARSELDILTDREREVLELLAQGMTNKEIAEMLFISTNTVKRHIKAIFEKLDIHTRSAAAAKALVASSGTVGVEG